MFIFRHGSKCAALRLVTRLPTTNARRYASRIDIPIAPPPFPVIEACPAPTCQCRETPSGLDIEREQNINGSMPAYAEQVLISTGRSDWKSRIEDDEESVLARQLKGFLGRGGKYSDPYHNVLLTNSSFATTESPGTASTAVHVEDRISASTASAFLLPSFQYIPKIPTDSSSLETFIKAFILSSQLHQSHDRITRAEQNILLRQPERQREFIGARKVDEIIVLICGHGGRDVRCGTLGPILKAEFEEKLERQNVTLFRDEPVVVAKELNTEANEYSPAARVGLISHIGGHKWAGNVIVYIPPSFKRNSLAGRGIWYGRVGPEHVEGIVEKTVLGGTVIKELFRGGIDQDRKIMRL